MVLWCYGVTVERTTFDFLLYTGSISCSAMRSPRKAERAEQLNRRLVEQLDQYETETPLRSVEVHRTFVVRR